MFLTYEDSVLEAADENGNLTYNQVVRLLADHDVEIEELYAYPQDIDRLLMSTTPRLYSPGSDTEP